MNTNTLMTASVATELISSRVRDAKARRLVVQARHASRTRHPEVAATPIRVPWFSRPATA